MSSGRRIPDRQREAIREYVELGHSIEETAALYRVSARTVEVLAGDIRRRAREDRDEAIVDAVLRGGKCLRDVAADFGMAHTTVLYTLRKAGCRHAPGKGWIREDKDA